MQVDLGTLVKSRDAAKRLDVVPTTVVKFIHRQEISAVKLGNNWYIEKGELERFARNYKKLIRRTPMKVLPVDLSKYVKITEAARRLGVWVSTVRRMIYRGELPAIKIDGTWLIERDKFEDFLSTYVRKKTHQRMFSPTEGVIDLNKYARVPEVARWLGVNPATVRKVVYRGELPAIGVGNGWLIERAVLTAKGASASKKRPPVG